MISSTMIVGIICLVIGIGITWIFRRLIFETKHVTSKQFDEINRQLQESLMQKAVLEESNKQILAENERVKIQLSETNKSQSGFVGDIGKKSAQIESLASEKEAISNELLQTKNILVSKNDELTQVLIQMADKDAKIRYQQEQQQTYKKEMQDMGEKLKSDFKILANSILDEKTQKFTQLNSDNLKTILDPLKKDLGEFKTKVEETYDKESKERFSLGEKIKDLVDLNHKISDEAHNLTRALKGEVKKQGDWGEMILESVLEKSGLVKDREYLIQEFIRDEAGNIIKNEDGQGMKPDVIINYPDKRSVVVDSKVSLNAYERFANADDKETQDHELNAHIQSLRIHVDDLSRKNYQNYLNSLDWVVMFVPIEPAYLVALRKDSELWNYAFHKKIIMVCPSNLLAVLKITADLWKREFHNQNALEIARRGGQLYDKFVGFVDTMQELGGTINKAQETYEKAFGQLKSGSGNLIRQAELMRKLEVKSNKKLPAKLINEAMEDDVPQIDTCNSEIK